MRKDKAYAGQLLDRLIELDQQTQSAYYEMGQLLSAIKNNKLYELLGYNSFKEIVEEELSFTDSTAARYANTYDHFRRLHYTKKEALDMIQMFGYTHMADILPTVNDKIGKRAIRTRIDKLGKHQVNFMLNDQQYDTFLQTFESLGAEYSESGRMVNSSEVFLALLKAANLRSAA